jgi:hypothetical protein
MSCTAALLSRIYVFAAFDGRWSGVTFLILALGPIAPGSHRTSVPSSSKNYNTCS